MSEETLTPQEQPEAGGTLSGRIEAILFVAGEPVRVEDLSRALGVTVRQIENEIVKLYEAT